MLIEKYLYIREVTPSQPLEEHRSADSECVYRNCHKLSERDNQIYDLCIIPPTPTNESVFLLLLVFLSMHQLFRNDRYLGTNHTQLDPECTDTVV